MFEQILSSFDKFSKEKRYIYFLIENLSLMFVDKLAGKR